MQETPLMLTAACPHCRRRYQVRSEIVPARGIRARCPHCGALFSIVPSVTEPAPNGASQAEARPLNGAGSSSTIGMDSGNGAASGHVDEEAQDSAEPGKGRLAPPDVADSPVEDEGIVWGEELEKARPERGVFGEVRPRAAAAGAGAEVLEAETPAQESSAPQDHARSLARALASDLLEYHLDSCRVGVSEMRLIELLGRQVARSWDLYVEDVGVEFAQTTDHFQQAFNEILAGRRRYF